MRADAAAVAQYNRSRRRALSAELLQQRQEWEQQEAERAASTDAKRVQQATVSAREELRRQQEQQRKYQEEAARESERLRAERDAARRQYDSRQAALDAELGERVAREQALIEVQRAAARTEEERLRRVRDEEEARVEAERRRQEEAERLQREVSVQRRLEEQQALERQKRRFALRVEGSVLVSRPPKGTLLDGPLAKEATLQFAIDAGTLLGGRAGTAVSRFGSSADADEALPALVAGQCHAATEAYESSARLQAMTGEGPLSAMAEAELRHWMALSTCRSSIRATSAALAGLQAFQRCSRGVPQLFEERTEYGVLPRDSEQSSTTRFSRVAGHLEEGRLEDAAAVLLDMMEDEDQAFYAGLAPLPAGLDGSPQVLGGALLLGFFMSWAEQAGEASEERPGWLGAALSLAEQLLQKSVAGAARDTLQLPVLLLIESLGPGHPLLPPLASISEANMSSARRREREDRERMHQAELAAQMLEEERPDVAQTRAERLAEMETKTPVPERVWALRNVAGTLAMGGLGERSRARQLLEQAVQLKQRFSGSLEHPSVLPELVALHGVLRLDSQWAPDAAAVAGKIIDALSTIALAYQSSGDVLSAAVLLEAAVAGYGQSAGLRKQVVTSAVRRADDLTTVLAPAQRATLVERRHNANQVLERVLSALTDELGAYQATATSRAEQWDRMGVQIIGPLAA